MKCFVLWKYGTWRNEGGGKRDTMAEGQDDTAFQKYLACIYTFRFVSCFVLFSFVSQMLPEWAGNCRGGDESPAAASKEPGLILPAAEKLHMVADRSRPQMDKSTFSPTPTGFQFIQVLVCYWPKKHVQENSLLIFPLFFICCPSFVSMNHVFTMKLDDMKIHIPQNVIIPFNNDLVIHKGLLHLPGGVTHLAILAREKQFE